ncbi:mitochondrial amino-acid acetyltransferase [Diplogelasinospora grovesii]|uniref:Amino-acid acetyltransferase, mitochondrial n=1 Tax=Diplogelasinospora grovesii TaxID=303347 RepID=A0AAN6NDP8_9PEZI|nr:mitochondrial amino-acid acetyltransferase [Diplogelasinospora grovesii]
MFVRVSHASKRVTSAAQASIRRDGLVLPAPEDGFQTRKVHLTGPRSSHASSAEGKQKREQDRQFLISVLESSATKRDAKAYLQTFGPALARGGDAQKRPTSAGGLQDSTRAVSEKAQFVQGPQTEANVATDDKPHVAIVKLREPQSWDDALLDGVVRTLTQLRELGLLSVIVLDCGADQAETSPESLQKVVTQQTDRLLKAIGRHGYPAAQLVNSSIWKMAGTPLRESQSPVVASTDLFVGSEDTLITPLRHGHLLVVSPRACSEQDLKHTAADPDTVVLTLASFFAGLQHDRRLVGPEGMVDDDPGCQKRPVKKASVDRIIVVDPLGGIPSPRQGHGTQVFINLEQEFDPIQEALHAKTSAQPTNPRPDIPGDRKSAQQHMENLRLVRHTLALLPSTSSAIITSPTEAANFRGSRTGHDRGREIELVAGGVKTRRWQNPLIHNLLTDRPIYSSSLPLGRIKSPKAQGANFEVVPNMPTTTLAKKGLPVTIFPDPRTQPWLPPKPGSPRLRLTDTCIDLPRLVHLIDDSFNRKLDVEHYLNRVKDSLAGIIIAGEYEGGAILTWERPFGVDEETAFREGRMVPYLDKFAVLKKSQGAGGVSDIVFNAMVRDCFPSGVCWRSRKNNPVNKWYFERSRGVRKLPDSNWAMFWTTPEAALDNRMMDYEDVCRNIEPSWADKKKAAD